MGLPRSPQHECSGAAEVMHMCVWRCTCHPRLPTLGDVEHAVPVLVDAWATVHLQSRSRWPRLVVQVQNTGSRKQPGGNLAQYVNAGTPGERSKRCATDKLVHTLGNGGTQLPTTKRSAPAASGRAGPGSRRRGCSTRCRGWTRFPWRRPDRLRGGGAV